MKGIKVDSSAHQFNVDFSVNEKDLYREETFMDLKIAQIRRLTPVYPNGSTDDTRDPVFLGYTKVMSPKGPVSLHCKIKAKSLKEAINKFPQAMNQAVQEIADKAQK